MTAFIKTYADPEVSLQEQFDVAVVMPTVLRPEIQQAVRSIFAQDIAGRIQILIGIDNPRGDLSLIDDVCAERPSNCVVQVMYPGYSTSVKHGGVHLAQDGGALRCILSFCANSPRIAYLDDDNWWRADHLRLLQDAIAHADWAYALRWFVHPVSGRPIGVDLWESVGPGRGVFQQKFGGFVDTNCLMISMPKCADVLSGWTRPLPNDPGGASTDRIVFARLSQNFKSVGTGQPTAFYRLNPNDGNHPHRVQRFGQAYDRAGEPAPE
jgi:hypothetical protein